MTSYPPRKILYPPVCEKVWLVGLVAHSGNPLRYIIIIIYQALTSLTSYPPKLRAKLPAKPTYPPSFLWRTEKKQLFS